MGGLTYMVTHLGFQGGMVVKNLPANAEDLVQSLGQEDPLEDEMTTHSSTLYWRIPRTEQPGGATVHGVEQSRIWLSTQHPYI